MRDWLFLPALIRLEDLALLLLRVGTGAFLVYGTWDNVSEPARMAEFAGFLRQFGFPAPGLMAPLSAYAQFLGGLLLIGGFLTRWNGLVQALQFTVAIVMVDRFAPTGLRGVWPAGALVLIGLYLAARGAGRLSVDAAFEPRRR
jgi:putative oxidoreductase